MRYTMLIGRAFNLSVLIYKHSLFPQKTSVDKVKSEFSTYFICCNAAFILFDSLPVDLKNVPVL